MYKVMKRITQMSCLVVVCIAISGCSANDQTIRYADGSREEAIQEMIASYDNAELCQIAYGVWGDRYSSASQRNEIFARAKEAAKRNGVTCGIGIQINLSEDQ